MTRIAIIGRPDDQLEKTARAAINVLRLKNIKADIQKQAEQGRHYIWLHNVRDVDLALTTLTAAAFDAVQA